MNEMSINRRHFLQGATAATLLGAAGLLGACAPKGESAEVGEGLAATGEEAGAMQPVDETRQCDIVIVGAGAAGLAAAVEAGEAGASVICIERMEATGGDAVGVEGVFAVGSRMQRDEGVDVSAGTLVRMELEAGQHRVPGANYVDMVRNSGENLDWLLDHGVTFGSLDADKGEYRVFHRYATGAGAEDYVAPMTAAANASGVEFMFGALADELVREGTGPVTGVICTDADGRRVQVDASAVIVATGGFAENFDMVAEAGINVEEAGYIGLPGHDGSGHKMAVAAGAASNQANAAYQMCQSLKGLPSYFEGGKFSFLIGVASPFSLWLNENGERFVNEDFAAVNAMMMCVPTWPNKFTYVVMDQAKMDMFCGGDAEAAEQLAQGLDLGVIVKADTMEELAEAMGMDASVVADTMTRYNGFCEEGVDEDFGKDPAMLMPFGDGPSYGLHITPDILVSNGSVKTDRNFNAVDEAGEPIEGLYVVGVEGAMLWSNIYTINVSGACNANNINSGRMAVKNALAR